VIKFTASGNGITLVGLGLQAENIRRMQDGQPVRVRLSDLGFVGAVGAVQVVIFTGKTDDEMETAISAFCGPNTVVIREGGQ